eukprot:Nk52_evm1s2070 gene=Nk52_evmTU1s2070
MRLVLYGEGGTGKSHVIHTIRNASCDDDGNDTVLVAAFTGCAAHNIRGVTLHSAFALRVKQGRHASANYNMATNLSRRNLMKMQNKFAKIKSLIIDEYSMVPYNMLIAIDERLKQFKGNNE